MGTDSRFYKVFYDGMDHHSTIVMKKILDTYKGFEGISTLVDVGGATGLCLNLILSKYPSIKAINFDLPHIIRDAPTYPGNNNPYFVYSPLLPTIVGLFVSPKVKFINLTMQLLDTTSKNIIMWDLAKLDYKHKIIV